VASCSRSAAFLICTAHHDAREVIEIRIPRAFSLIDDRQFVAADEFSHVDLPKDKVESAFAVASPVSFRGRGAEAIM
jgi:hypothetical protein